MQMELIYSLKINKDQWTPSVTTTLNLLLDTKQFSAAKHRLRRRLSFLLKKSVFSKTYKSKRN